VKVTDYFRYTRQRADRRKIQWEWIMKAQSHPVYEEIQSDGRIRRWVYIAEEGKWLRVILLKDNETIHNAFFDRRFKPPQ